jgi:hypothetical protein
MTLALFADAEVQHELVQGPLGGGSALRTPFGPATDVGQDGVGESYPASGPSVYQPRSSLDQTGPARHPDISTRLQRMLAGLGIHGTGCREGDGEYHSLTRYKFDCSSRIEHAK